MAYKFSKKSTGRRKTYRRTAASSKTVRKIALAVVRSQAETKQRSSNHNEAALDSLQTIKEHTPSRIRGGTMENERIGNDVSMFAIDVRGYVHNNSTTDVMHVRAMAIIDREKQGAATDLSELLLKNNSPVSQLEGAMSSVYAVNKQRYRVLWDTVYTLAPQQSGNGTANTRRFFKRIKCNLKVKFGDENDTSISQGDVKVIFFASEADNDLSLETVELYSQCTSYYKDI